MKSSEYIIDKDIKKILKELDDNKQIIYVAGKAGTGKSTFIEHLIQNTEKHHVVVAPTGRAALNINGQTIHSFFRFPPKLLNLKKDIKMRRDMIAQNIELLIIDEISMVRADIIDGIDESLRLWKSNMLPFGGVQILLVGDCFQLSPIVNTREKDIFYQLYLNPWFFSADVFDRIDDIACIELTHIYRQNDEKYVLILNNIRQRIEISQTLRVLNYLCYNKNKSDDNIYLTSTNYKANQINDYKLSKIDSKEHVYTGTYSGNVKLKNENLPVPDKLVFKNGTRVMVRRNIDCAVNGSLGTITECCEKDVIVKLDSGSTIVLAPSKWTTYKYQYNSDTKQIESIEDGHYTQIPLVLGWAITVHKSQGITLDKVTIDIGSGCFSSGQAYVALSRCRHLETLSLVSPLNDSDIMIDNDVLEFYDKIF